jgi:hypothetical protein
MICLSMPYNMTGLWSRFTHLTVFDLLNKATTILEHWLELTLANFTENAQMKSLAPEHRLTEPSESFVTSIYRL